MRFLALDFGDYSLYLLCINVAKLISEGLVFLIFSNIARFKREFYDAYRKINFQ